jgi:Fanconi anemia group M protein
MPGSTNLDGTDGNGKIRIVVDHRESKNRVFERLMDFGAELVCEQLKTGDFICSDRVAIERKTIPDLLQSIIDGRIFRQVSEISGCFERPLLIIEGSSDLLYTERNVHPNAIRGALASLAVDYKIPIIWTRNQNETASQIYWIAQREQVKDSRTPAIRSPNKSKSTRDMQEFLLAGLPDVNTMLSRNLLKKFRTPKRVFSASPEKLMTVEGIGELKARKIWELLNSTQE